MTICKGGHSVVVELINVKSHSRFAAKVIKKEHTRHNDDVIRNEIQIMRRVSGRHQNVLSLRDFFETPNNVYLVSDLYSGGDLFDRVLESGRLPEPQVTRIMRSLVGAVAYLHSNGIVHHDIKPENIVFKTMDMDSPLALADFGLAENVDHNGRCWNVGGTPGYMAPEITANRYHGKPSDMWALGIVSYFALSGHTPFGLRARAGFLEHSFAIECYRFLQFDIWNTISWPAIKFICELLVVDPARRLTAGQASRHSWLTQAAESSGNSLATAISPVEEIYDDEYLEGDYASYFNPSLQYRTHYLSLSSSISVAGSLLSTWPALQQPPLLHHNIVRDVSPGFEIQTGCSPHHYLHSFAKLVSRPSHWYNLAPGYQTPPSALPRPVPFGQPEATIGRPSLSLLPNPPSHCQLFLQEASSTPCSHSVSPSRSHHSLILDR